MFRVSWKFYWSGNGINLHTLIQVVFQRLSDMSLPVQIEVLKVRHFIIEVEGEEVTLLPILPNILHYYAWWQRLGMTRLWSSYIYIENHYNARGGFQINWPHLNHGVQYCRWGALIRALVMVVLLSVHYHYVQLLRPCWHLPSHD